MASAIGYVRVSTEEQAREGVSLAAQEAKIRAYCELNDLQLIQVVADAGKSGKDINREGLQAIVTAVESGQADAVVVLKLDRLSRRVVDTLTLIERIEAAGAGFHSIQEKVDTKSAVGRFFLTITAAFAQMERDTIAERTASALAHKKAIGEHVGRVPFGFSVSGSRLIQDASLTTTITLIERLRREGRTLQAIADELSAHGVPTQRGGRWHARTVKNILDRQVG